jgi:NAD(P)-dependent dehydrogenase (short-subunit alcohol dehydrogenase family)
MSSPRVAIISGGGGSIGRAVALRLAAEDVSVALFDVDGGRAQQVADEITVAGGIALGVAVDLRDADAIAHAVSAVVDKFGGVSILVTAAGGSARQRIAPLRDQSDAVLEEILDVNLRSVLLLCRAAIDPLTRAGGGRIITIGSIVGVQGLAELTEYAASKGGVIALTKALAMELGESGVTVNCVSPGQIPRDPDGSTTSQNYVGREGTPDDVARAVTFLASPDSSFITGHNLVVDGGRSLGLRGS